MVTDEWPGTKLAQASLNEPGESSEFWNFFPPFFQLLNYGTVFSW
jgi:hypothetical protein